jgi:hypothetical protein
MRLALPFRKKKKEALSLEGLNHNPIHTLERHVLLEKSKNWPWNYELWGRVGGGWWGKVRQNTITDVVRQVARNYRFLNLSPLGAVVLSASACQRTHCSICNARLFFYPKGAWIPNGGISKIYCHQNLRSRLSRKSEKGFLCSV